MSDDILARLAAPFSPEQIDWRAGSTNADKTRCMALAYIDARTVMDRLDEVMGPYWSCRYVPMHNGTTCCEIGLAIDKETWSWRGNGAGATDYEAEKGAYSDAFKRAAVLWGVGRYLYGIKSPWVACEAKGKSVIIADSELPRLRALLPGYSPPASKGASRAEYSRLSLLLKSAGDVASLATVWTNERTAIASLPDDWKRDLTREKDEIKALLQSRAA